MKYKDKLNIIFDKLIVLIENMDNYEYSCLFKEFKIDCEKLDCDGMQDFSKIVLNIYGGSGSFNDLILYKDGVLLTRENEELYQLRRELFILLNQMR